MSRSRFNVFRFNVQPDHGNIRIMNVRKRATRKRKNVEA